MSPRPKEVYSTPEQFEQARQDPAFQQVVALARIDNTIRFAHGAVVHIERDMSPSEERQLMSSFLYLSALLFEGLKLTRTLGKNFRGFQSFADGFARLHADPTVKELRTKVLDVVRNKVVYHLDSDVISGGLELLTDAHEFVFLSASDLTVGEIYFRLADEAVIHFIVGEKIGTAAFRDRFTTILSRTTDLSIRFSDSSAKLITEYLLSVGWHTRQ